MEAKDFVEKIREIGIDTLIGVPDSTLKEFCDYINSEGKQELDHYIAVNEGAAVGIAAGTYLATGIPSCVYMQNSGLGNCVNPITSLMNEEIYDIPMLLLIGWRGKPGMTDEPQHKFMGKITKEMLATLNIKNSVINKETTLEDLELVFKNALRELQKNHQYAIIVEKETFTKKKKRKKNHYSFIREDAIALILQNTRREDIVVSTTGKISREVYEQADKIYGQHDQEFLTLGGMGYASMIAFGIAQKQKKKKVYCLDGDGALLMHMGTLAFLGKENPVNMVHICLNNDAHESVGGISTGATGANYSKIAKCCGYKKTYSVETAEELQYVLEKLKKEKGLIFVEVKVAMDSREDLGRPKETAVENKKRFMRYHRILEEQK